jgi:hypothetical protein
VEEMTNYGDYELFSITYSLKLEWLVGEELSISSYVVVVEKGQEDRP